MTPRLMSFSVVLKLVCLLVVYLTPLAQSFSTSPWPGRVATTRLYVSQPLPDADDIPRNFGRPLDESTKEANKLIVSGIKSVIFDSFFAEDSMERSYARFWTLETIARMPYFSYLSVLHLYETLGWWRRSDYLKVHFLQTWNEQHHLLIMEELNGNRIWVDRFLAQHIAVAYYFMGLAFYIFNPTFAYNFNQAVEEEAFETYDAFLAKNKDILKEQPAPLAAKQYYLEDPLFAEMGRPRPTMETLLDAFAAIRDDEAEHAETMMQMQQEGL